MTMPREETRSETNEAWGTFMNSLEQSIRLLDSDIKEASQMASICTNEWCESTEHVIDELNNALFSISEPRWSDRDLSRKLKSLKGQVHNLYADYKHVYRMIH